MSNLGLLWPTPGFNRITSAFGPRTNPINGTVQQHRGIDIGRNLGPNPPAAPIEGANILAAADGRVSISGFSASAGNWIIIDHAGGVQTVYMHNQSNAVRVGDQVRRGQIIGRVGNTGHSTGPHLHWEVRVNGVAVNPMLHIGSPSPSVTPLTTTLAPAVSPNANVITPQASGNLYRVQVGAFGVRANAEAMVAKLQALGWGLKPLITQPCGLGLVRVQVGAFGVRQNAINLRDRLLNVQQPRFKAIVI